MKIFFSIFSVKIQAQQVYVIYTLKKILDEDIFMNPNLIHFTFWYRYSNNFFFYFRQLRIRIAVIPNYNFLFPVSFTAIDLCYSHRVVEIIIYIWSNDAFLQLRKAATIPIFDGHCVYCIKFIVLNYAFMPSLRQKRHLVLLISFLFISSSFVLPEF